MLHVIKGGGTTVANSERLENFIDIALADERRRIIVLSAPGKLGDEEKLTDLLINATNDRSVREKNVRAFRDRFAPIYGSGNVPADILNDKIRELERRLETYDSLAEDKKDISPVKMFGEFMIAEPAAGILRKKGKSAVVLYPENMGMVIDFKKGRINDEAYPLMKTHIGLALKKNDLIIVPGFYCVDDKGRIVTFPRGGSDTTGAVVAKAAGAGLYENFTDVTKIYSGDPNIIGKENVKPNDALSFTEVIEMSYMGAKVIHHSAVTVCMEANIPIRLRSSFHPENEGTLISSRSNGKAVKGISYKNDFYMIDVFDPRMIGGVGYALDMLEVLKSLEVPFEHITTSIASISVSINKNELPKGILLDDIAGEIKRKMKPDRIGGKYYNAMVCIVGEGMKHIPGILGRAGMALAREKININTVYQGPSESNIILGVDNDKAIGAVRALHDEFFNKSLLKKAAYWVNLHI